MMPQTPEERRRKNREYVAAKRAAMTPEERAERRKLYDEVYREVHREVRRSYGRERYELQSKGAWETRGDDWRERDDG